MDESVKNYLLISMFNAAIRAGAAIMSTYKNGNKYDISIKSDKTPLTLADKLAHNAIQEYLGQTRIPILSEEGREMLYDERCNWELFWLIDPLDGTIEFIKGNNEFTVNIALMENNISIASIIYVPYLNKAYIARKGGGVFLKEDVTPDANADYSYEEITNNWVSLPKEISPRDRQIIAVSRSHQTPDTAEFIDNIRKSHPLIDVVEQGSSYKFCLLAEGSVDYYVRTTHTYEWDTAAGELILSESGGETLSLPEKSSFEYNKEDLRNPWFISRSKYCMI